MVYMLLILTFYGPVFVPERYASRSDCIVVGSRMESDNPRQPDRIDELHWRCVQVR